MTDNRPTGPTNDPVSDAPSKTYQRILLTGGSGFVGGYLAPALSAAYPHAERVMLCRAGDQTKRPGWRNRQAEFADARAIEALIADFQPDLVLHLAAQASVGESLHASEATWRVNFSGTLELAAACARHTPNATFFFVSSSEVYGWSFRDGPAPETAALQPMSAYARSKAAAEAMLPDVLGANAKLIIVRPFNHTGPGQDVRFVLPAITAQIAEIEAGRKQRLDVGNLEAVRDFLDVRDVCAAYLALLEKADNLPSGAIFNVTSGRRHRIGDLIEALRAMAYAPFVVHIDQKRLRPLDIPLAVGDISKLAATTGWSPKIPIEDTMESLLRHWRMTPLAQSN